MRPFVRAALTALTILVLARLTERVWGSAPPSAALAPSAAPAPGAPCPAGSLPDDSACIPVPEARGALAAARGKGTPSPGDESGSVQSYDHIPLRPERPADYRKYGWPVPIDPNTPGVSVAADEPSSGEDNVAEGATRRQEQSALHLAARRGTAVRALFLERQTAPTEVLWTGELFGTTVVTLHRVKEPAGEREYVVVYAHLERAAANVTPAREITKDAIVGFVGDSGSPGAAHLHLEIRRVREGVGVRGLTAPELVQSARTIAVDARNVVELTP